MLNAEKQNFSTINNMIFYFFHHEKKNNSFNDFQFVNNKRLSKIYLFLLENKKLLSEKNVDAFNS